MILRLCKDGPITKQTAQSDGRSQRPRRGNGVEGEKGMTLQSEIGVGVQVPREGVRGNEGTGVNQRVDPINC